MDTNKALERVPEIVAQLRRDGYIDAADLIEQLTAGVRNDRLTCDGCQYQSREGLGLAHCIRCNHYKPEGGGA